MLKQYSVLIHLAAALIIFLSTLVSAAALLPPDEVETLKQIAKSLGKRNWNFSVDPCSGEENWTTAKPVKGFENEVACDCTFLNNTVCHVVNITLKGQSLPGILPKELVNLPYLRLIDFTRNYLNGSIPVEWASTKLTDINLIGNRISGPLPKQLGNLSTLVTLTLEYNQLSGAIPPEMGNLLNLQRLLLTSNNLTGELPGTLAKLTSLTDFRVSDNRFVGSIPEFIQNWTNLNKLVIQASGLNGPIPSGIALLKNLTDLRISDLGGNGSAFPDLSGMTKMKTLILRSCNISGVIPAYLGSVETLKLLDLSFNKLTGQIPLSFSSLSTTDYVYLTGNLLTGPVPDWVLKSGGDYRDLSYNNFTSGSSAASTCQGKNLNLFSSISKGNTSGVASCLRSFRCPQVYYSFHIDCGGAQDKAEDKTIYEADLDAGGPSNFYQSRSNWAFSSTGNFLDDDRPRDTYIWTNSSPISGKNSKLYTTARLSPLSLTYYGFCLQNGNYTVNLHFAEIMFTNDTTFSSLGKRLFDIYVQGKVARKNFNIVDEAGGVNKAVVVPFPAQVTDNTLEIRFYWAGKGTNGIPVRGVYGPLISAISVNPNFPVPSANKNSLSGGAIAGIVIGVLFAISLLLVLLWWNGCFNKKDANELDLKGLDLHTGSFTLRQIKAATNNFDKANKIGEGGFGSVYKGNLLDGTTIAVKQLSAKSKQGNREFVNEIGMISALQHPNLVKLYGCCVEGNQLLLVYEYLENNSLARALFGPEEHQLTLDWPTRHRICVGIARGLAFLHEESTIKIVHRDIKATNVLLDKNLDPKISDFGLARLDDEDNTHISTRIAGTFGYMAPEYAMRGYLTDKADVYSFGVVLLEIVSGRSNTSIRPKQDSFNLLDWANELKEEGNLMELVDPRLEADFNKKEVMSTISIGLLCADVLATARPSMSTVVSMLEHGEVDPTLVADSNISNNTNHSKDTAFLENGFMNQKEKRESISIDDVSWTTNTASTGDLYPVSFTTNPSL